ncbi:neutral amino acid transporter 9-like [Ornithodoros turicata]|uniref:neutral amino acid transporter 9-like n=1 Tax=Ornithodoros turicata TaxID=34597 RepID=UPI00313927F1
MIFCRNDTIVQEAVPLSIGERGYVINDADVAANYSRYRYYNRLVEPASQILAIPDHVLPPYFFVPFFNTQHEEQSSFVTIFAIWNTMMGTSLLSMPWAISQQGFVAGILLIVAIGGLCLYTAYRVLSSPQLISSSGEHIEFFGSLPHTAGKMGREIIISLFHASTIGGHNSLLGSHVYFLSNVALYIYDHVAANEHLETLESSGLICGKANAVSQRYVGFSSSLPSNSSSTSVILTVLENQATMPVVLVVLLFPLINLKSPSFFYKFNALGTISVFYLLIYILVMSFKWGINVNFVDKEDVFYAPMIQKTLPALTGILCLSYFIHNCVISMMRHQKNPQNNVRDLSIAYALVTVTYLLIGVTFYVSFPLAKQCLEDNLLNNFPNNDVMAFVTRIFLLVQYTTLFPMVAYLLRVQFMHWMYNSIYPGLKHVLSLNLVVVTICVIFAIFLPQIGTILRYCGALSGLVYIFSLPCLIYMVALRQQKRLTVAKAISHSFIIVLGVANFVSQCFLEYLSD